MLTLYKICTIICKKVQKMYIGEFLMKKRIFTGLIVCFIAILSIFGFTACDKNSTEKTENSIELTMENYSYLLSITTQLTDSGSIAGGSYRYASYEVYINGAVSGLYVNCALTLESGKKILLNASGFAQTTKSVVNGKDSFKIVEVEGKIFLY